MRLAYVTLGAAVLMSSAVGCVLVTNFDVQDRSTGSVGGASSTASSSAGPVSTTADTSASSSTGSGMLAPFVVSADLSSASEVHLSSVIEGPNESIWFAGRYGGTITIGSSTLSATGDFFVGHIDADGSNLSAFTLGVGESQSAYDNVTLAWAGTSEIWFLTAQQSGGTGVANLGWFDPTNPTATKHAAGSCVGGASFQHPGLALNVPIPSGPADVVFGFSTNGQHANCSFLPLPSGVPCSSKQYDAPAADEPDTLLWYARRSIGTCYDRRIREESGPGSFQSVPRLAIDPTSLNVLLVGRYTGHLFDSVDPIQTADPMNVNVANEFAAELAPSGTSLAVLADWDLGGYDDPGGAQPSISPAGEWLIGGSVFPLGVSAFQQDASKHFQGKTSGYIFRTKPLPESVDLWTASPGRSSVTGLRAYADRSLLLGTAANEVPLNAGSLTAPCHAAQSGDCYSAYWAILDGKENLVVGAAYGLGSGAASPSSEPRYVFLGGFLTKDGRVALGGQMGGDDAGTMTLGGQTITSAATKKTMFLAALDPRNP